MKWMYLLTEDDEKYNTVWDKVSAGIKKELRTCLQQSFLKTKIKSYCDEATDFHNKEISKVGSNHTCLADTALKKGEDCFSQVFLNEFKYIEKEKNVIRHIIDDLERSSDDSDGEKIKAKYQVNVL